MAVNLRSLLKRPLLPTPLRGFSRKGTSMKDLLSTQKTKLDDSEHDLFHILSKQPEILDSLVQMRRAKTAEELAYRQN
jgi:hypothetical protein